MPTNSSCDRTQTLHGWEISLVQPAGNIPSSTFQYSIVRQAGFPTSRQISNILICLCPDITNAERLALLKSCSYSVYYDDNSSETFNDCYIENTITPPAANPAECRGLKFDDIPSGSGDTEQTQVVLNFTLTETLPVGPVRIGLKAGPSDTSGVWENICGPVCEPVPAPPTRGIMF